MLIKNLTEVWISKYETINNHGEKSKKWNFKKLSTKTGTAFLNLQQDINELDRKPTGEVDYSIENARTTMDYDIKKGNGISLRDISKEIDFVPDYVVTDSPRVGNSILYKLEKYNGKV